MEFPAALREQFTPQRLLGQGGFGSVWLARQAALDRPVALKTMHADLVGTDEQVSRFQDEARLTAALRHPHVVRLLDHGLTAGQPWMAFEFVDGPSLRAWVERGPAPWREVLEIGRQVALALEEARRSGVIHRDIKPDNILQAGPGEFKVADFGIAKWAGNVTQTAAGVVLGTPAYISPQQVRGHLPAHHTDLYALGVTLYELIAGHTPFCEENAVLMLERHLTATPPRLRDALPDLPEGVERFILRLLSKNREDRFETGAELAQQIGELLERAGPAAEAPPEGLASGRARRSGASGVTRVASVRVQTPAAARLARSVRGHAGLGVAVAALVALAALWREAPRPMPSPTPTPTATPAPAPSPAGTALRELEQDALTAHREASTLHGRHAREEDVILGLDGGRLRENLASLETVLQRYLALVRRLRALDGTDSDDLHVVHLVSGDILRTAAVTLRLLGFAENSPAQRKLDHVPALTTLAAVLREVDMLAAARSEPLRALRAEFGPMLELFSERRGLAGWYPEAVPEAGERSLVMLEALISRGAERERPRLLLCACLVAHRAVDSWRAIVDQTHENDPGRAARAARRIGAPRKRLLELLPRAAAAVRLHPGLPLRLDVMRTAGFTLAASLEDAGATPAEKNAVLDATERVMEAAWPEWSTRFPLLPAVYGMLGFASLCRVPITAARWPWLAKGVARAKEPREIAAQTAPR